MRFDPQSCLLEQKAMEEEESNAQRKELCAGCGLQEGEGLNRT